MNSKCIDENVIYSPLGVHVTKLANRKVKYIVIHFTGGSNSNAGKALGVKSVFESREASADFAVDDRDMVQFNPDIKNYYCWAVGGKAYGNKGGSLYGKATNRNCVSIEICSTCNPATREAVKYSNHGGWLFTPAALANARKLTKLLMAKYQIPVERVIRHYDVNGKHCPGIYGWNDEPLVDIQGKRIGKQNNSSAWIEFKRFLSVNN